MSNRPQNRKPVSRKRRTRKIESPPKGKGESRALVRRQILVVLSLLFCVEGTAAVFTSPWLQVHRVELRGVAGLMPEEIGTAQTKLALPAQTNFFQVPTGAFAAKLRALPFVQNVTLTRRFPDTLEAKLMIRQPIAIVEVDGQPFEVDPTGVAIRAARPELAARLPHIAAPTGTALSLGGVSGNVSVNTAVGVIEQLASPTDSTKIGVAKIDIDSNGNLCLNMSDKMKVFLGSPDEMPEKVDKLRRLYRDAPDVATRLAEVNLTVPQYPACILRSNWRG